MLTIILFICISLLIILFILAVLNIRTKNCIKCKKGMMSYGSVGDGEGPDYDYQLWKCSCGHTEEDLIKG